MCRARQARRELSSGSRFELAMTPTSSRRPADIGEMTRANRQCRRAVLAVGRAGLS